ncbi:MAG: inositol-3-phosphate synthase [Nitrososphaeria archaeon]
MPKIRVALIGVGNCASSFLQGIYFYSKEENAGEGKGLRYFVLGGFKPSDIEVVAAFDIDKRKVGKDLSEAIFAHPNDTLKVEDVPKTGVIVRRGPVLDGVGEALKSIIQVSNKREEDVAKVLKDSGAEIVVNLLPSGAIKATYWYADQAIKAGCSFVNTTPVLLASEDKWNKRFKDVGLILVGDDLIDQVGSTTLHKALLTYLTKNGVRITETFQLDVGGGTESIETMDRSHWVKRKLKTEAIKSSLPYEAGVVAGSTDFVPFLKNQRESFFWIKGTYFCNAPMKIDLKLSTIDAPNSASVLYDVVRAIKIVEKKQKGVVLPISAYAFKHPPKLLPIETAEKMFNQLIKQ